MKFKSFAISFALSATSMTTLAADILVPSYFNPSVTAGTEYWNQMTQALIDSHKTNPTFKITAILNPDSGPSDPSRLYFAENKQSYTDAVTNFKNAGGNVVGYVSTCYGEIHCPYDASIVRTLADIKTDIDKYTTYYPGLIDGYFLDEMASGAPFAGKLAFYTEITNYIRNVDPAKPMEIIGNAGVFPQEMGYFNIVDTVVTREESSAPVSNIDNTDWLTQADPSHQARLFHDVSFSSTTTEAELIKYITDKHLQNAGYVYINDPHGPNPWDTLPAYWSTEVKILASTSAVPLPMSGLLFLSGLLPLWLRKKFKPISAAA